MAVKLRLSRQGRKKAPFYHIVVVDSRAPRDGKFIQKIGTYNPMTKPATIEIDRNAAYDWLTKGAQPTDTVRAILRFKGVYYKKHLMRGVKKGALTIEQADDLWTKWIDAKEAKITSRVESTKAEIHAFRQKVSGEVKPVKAVVEEAAAPVVEENEGGDVVEAAADEAPVEDVQTEDTAAETPSEEAASEDTPTEE